jgi:hypothetical protein
MAAATITSRRSMNHGRMRAEIINFTDDTTSTYAIRTKLGRVTWFIIEPVGSAAAANLEAYANSASASTVENDPGFVFVNAGATSGGTYSLLAIGY